MGKANMQFVRAYANLKPAVRTYNKLLTRYGKAQEGVAEADRNFDAGEWSDAFHATEYEKTVERMLMLVARCYKVLPDDIYAEYERWMHDERGMPGYKHA